MVIYEVDLRERKTGNSVECIYSGDNSNEAYEIANNWNKEHGLGEIQEDYESYEELCDHVSDGLFADVYHVEKESLVHGVGKYEKERYFVYTFIATEKQIDELENHLKMNGYDFSINGEKISVHEEENKYVETIMYDRGIYYNLVDVEFK